MSHVTFDTETAQETDDHGVHAEDRDELSERIIVGHISIFVLVLKHSVEEGQDEHLWKVGVSTASNFGSKMSSF